MWAFLAILFLPKLDKMMIISLRRGLTCSMAPFLSFYLGSTIGLPSIEHFLPLKQYAQHSYFQSYSLPYTLVKFVVCLPQAHQLKD